MKEIKKLVEDRESKRQWVWVLLIRIIGMIMFIAPMYLPIKAYFVADIENVVMSVNDILMAGTGMFISAGGKQIGILLNNIGVALGNLIRKITD